MGYVLCFFGGGFVGVVVMCLMCAARENRDEREKLAREIERVLAEGGHF